MGQPIVITGGGTGGHVFPMLAVAEQLVRDGVERTDIRFVGSRRGQEATLLANSGIELILLPGRGIRRSLTLAAMRDNVGAVVGLAISTVRAVTMIRRWRPAAVVSVGGYASFPVALSAVVWRRPLVLVELDAETGIALRVVSRFAQRRCRAFPSNEARTVLTGAPVRDAIAEIDRSPQARATARHSMIPAIDDDRTVVVVMTGSLGSNRINRAVSELAGSWADRDDVTIIHVTGRRDFKSVEAARPKTTGLDYRIVEFGDMSSLWAVADVALCRAGALTVAELTVLGIPSILVPLPGAPGDHQTKNAALLASAGAARTIADSQCDATSIARVLDEMSTPSVLASMAERARGLGYPHATESIARTVLEVVR